MSVNKMICVVCPLGCRLTVSMKDSDYVVQGNKCDRGVSYAINELTNPLRTVTSTVRINSSYAVRLPVKTEHAFPKGKILDLMSILSKIKIEPPIQCGEVILNNVLSTGIDVVSTKTIREY